MCRDQRRNLGLFLVFLSSSVLGTVGFSYNQNGRFPMQRIERRSQIGGGILRTPVGGLPFKSKHSCLLATPVPPNDLGLNGNGMLGLDADVYATSGQIAKTTFFWLMLQEGMQGGSVADDIVRDRTAGVVAFGIFTSFLFFLGTQFFMDRDTEIEIPETADPDAYRRAKSGADLLDPDRQWDDIYLNYNDGAGPFGFKKNAEIWNGRVAMLSFVWVVAQEVATDKGILASLKNGESSAVTALACFLTLIGGFTSIIVSADEEEKDYIERVVSREALEKNAADPNWRPETVEKPYYPLKPSSVAQVSTPLTYDAYMRSRAAGAGAIGRSTKPQSALSPDVPSNVELANDRPVSYQIIPPRNPSPLWSGQRSPQRPRTYRSIKAEGMKHPFPAYGIPAAEPQIVAALQESYDRSARLPVSDLKLFDKTELDREIQKISDAYDTSKWSFELAELWNGRFAQIAFVVVFAQETVQRKGVLRGIEQSNPINLVGLLSVFLAMVGVGAAFTVGVGESQESTRAPALLSGDPRRSTVQRTDTPKFKVDGYRFKTDTPTTIAIGDSSPHPAGSFHFNADNSHAIQEGAGIPAEKPDPSNFKVDGYRFKTNTPTTIAIGDTSPHPAGSFSFNDENTGAIQSSEQQPTDDPDPSDFKVDGYRFKQSTQSAIHPGGSFSFGNDNTSAIQIGAGIPIEATQAQPPKDMIPHPVKSFVFGPVNEPVIKSATRNTSVPSPNASESSSSYETNDQYESSFAYGTEQSPPIANGYIPTPNYDSPAYERNGKEQHVSDQPHDGSNEHIHQKDQVYVGVNGATNNYLNSLGARWEQ